MGSFANRAPTGANANLMARIMTARIISGPIARVVVELLTAPRGITVKEWITLTARKGNGDK